ncbi:MAG: hypothetical protein WBB31_17160 [Saprospiraceae bacterium]
MSSILKKKPILKILVCFLFFIVVIKIAVNIFTEPWLCKKIELEIHTANEHYVAEIKKVNISLLPPGIKIHDIKICLASDLVNSDSVICEIESITLQDINLLKALFRHDVEIRLVTINKTNMDVTLSISKKDNPPLLMPLNIHVGKIQLNGLNMIIRDSLSAKSFISQECYASIDDFLVHKGYELSFDNIDNLNLRALLLGYISPDSLYTYKADSFNYSSSTQTLSATHFNILPNYKGYDFTSRSRYQTDRIEASFTDILLYNFCAEDLLTQDRFNASYCEIGRLDLDVFRDRRKEFQHKLKPVFQDIFYKIPVTVNLDSVNLVSGNIVYTEHAENANHPGTIQFREAKASLYNISNDSIRLNSNDSLKLIAEALVAGKGKLHIRARGKLFDSKNTFVMNGSLSSMAASDLNHILNHNAFIYAFGKIKTLNFGFTANNYAAHGKMLFLYNDLAITLKNKTTDDTTGFKERLLTKLANKTMLDSNPLNGQDSRVGIIEYKRDPEKTFFNYCLKSILSGIKSSVDKSSIRKKD